MGVMAPEWYISSFIRSVAGAGATAPVEEIEQVGRDLLERWSAPDRHFHDLRHLGAVLHRVDELAEETHSPDVVRLAAWYHGAVFDAASKSAYASAGGEQTSASAELARAELSRLGVSRATADRVAHLVNGLLRHAPDANDLDACVLNDADLAMLAGEPQRYREYTAAVRSEYEHIPLPDYLTARIKVLSRLLARDSLFLSPMGATWEDAARQNVEAELHRLRKKQAAQAPGGPQVTGT